MAVTKDIKNLTDLLSMPVTVLTCDQCKWENVTVIAWDNSYGLVCQMVDNTMTPPVPYWCYVPTANIARIYRRSNA